MTQTLRQDRLNSLNFFTEELCKLLDEKIKMSKKEISLRQEIDRLNAALAADDSD